MNRTLIAALIVVSTFVACDAKSGPGETPVTAEHGQLAVPRAIPGALHGTVHTPDGKPVIGVMVTATSIDDPPRPVPELAVMTDDQGRYEWPLAHGRYRITVELPGTGNAAGEAEIPAPDGKTLDLTLAP